MEGSALKMTLDPPPEIRAVARLLPTDRCDSGRCDAQAIVRLQGASGLLIDFCARDYKLHATDLELQGFAVVQQMKYDGKDFK